MIGAQVVIAGSPDANNYKGKGPLGLDEGLKSAVSHPGVLPRGCAAGSRGLTVNRRSSLCCIRSATCRE